MYEYIVFQASELEKEIDIINDELSLAVKFINDDPKSSLTKARIVIEKIIGDIYVREVDSTGSNKSLAKLLYDDNFKKLVDERMRIRMEHIKNFGNMGPHPKPEDMYIDEKDVVYTMDALFDVLIWYVEKYLKKSGYRRELQLKLKTHLKGIDRDNNLNIEHTLGRYSEEEDSLEEHILDEETSITPGDTRQIFNKIPIRTEYINDVNKEIFKDIKQSKVSYEDIYKIKEVYVKSPSISNAKKLIENKNILIIENNDHVGKYSTGLWLLANMDVERIIQIHTFEQVIDLSKLEYINLYPSCGYIIDSFVFEKNSDYIDLLSKRLKDMGSYLILLADYVDKDFYSLQQYTFKYEGQLEFYEVLKKHLWYQLDTEEEYKNILCKIDNGSFKRYINDNLKYPYEVGYIINLILSYDDVSQFNEDDIRNVIPSKVEDEIKTWFDNNNSLEDISRFITLAIYNDCSYDQFKNESQSLKRFIIKHHNINGDEENSLSNINIKREDLLNKLRASTYTRKKNSVLGLVDELHIKFDNSLYPSSILKFVQSQLENIYEPLILWIRDNIISENSEENKKIVHVICEMCKNDFNKIKDDIIVYWAKGDNYQAGLTAAKVLSLLSKDSQYSNKVLNLVNHWAGLSKNKRLNWISLLCYSNSLGRMYPKKSLNRIYKISNNTSLVSEKTLIITFQRIFQYGIYDKKYYEYVLHTLARWVSSSQDEKHREMGLRIFVTLCENLVRDTSNNSNNYVLLSLTKDKNIRETYISLLLVYGMKSFQLRDEFSKILGKWTTNCSLNNKYKGSFIRLIGKIFEDGDGFVKDNLLYLLRDLSKNGDVSQRELSSEILTCFN